MTAMQIAMQRALRDDLERRLDIMRGQRHQLAALLLDSPFNPAKEVKTQAALRDVEIDLIRLESALEAADHAA